MKLGEWVGGCLLSWTWPKDPAPALGAGREQPAAAGVSRAPYFWPVALTSCELCGCVVLNRTMRYSQIYFFPLLKPSAKIPSICRQC